MKIKYFLTFIFLHFINTNILFSYYDDHHHVTYNINQSNQASNKIKLSTNYSASNNNNNNNHQEIVRNKAIQIAYFQCLSQEAIENLCKLNDNVVLFEQYHLYSNSSYFNYIESRPGYSNFILELNKKIHSNHGLRKSLRKMPGFDKKGFTDFIDQEVNRIQQQREKHEIEQLERIKKNNNNLNVSVNSKKDFEESFYIPTSNDYELVNRYRQRKEAFNNSINQNGKQFDYSNQVKNYKFTDSNAEFFSYCYGSMMDKQLHEELCEIRKSAIDLQTQYHNNENVEAFSGMILHFTALAKVQPSANVAFHLSDFSHYLLKAEEILVDGTKLGLKNLTKPFVHPIDDFLKPLCYAGISLGQALFEVVSVAADDPLSLTNPAYMIQRTTDLPCTLVNYVKENPKEAVATIVELLIPVGIAKLTKFAKLKKIEILSKSFKKLTQAEKYFQATSNAINKVINPIKTALQEAGEVLKIGLEHGKNALRNVIKVVKGEPELIAVGDLVVLQVSPEHFKDVEKLAEVVKNYNTTMKNFIDKIHKVGNDILDVMEKAGGHTLKRHVSKTNQELIKRAMQGPGKAASTFTNKKIAIKTVKESLRKHSDKISKWILSDVDDLVIEFVHKHSIGKYSLKGTRDVVDGLTKSRIVLRKDFTNKFGFKIITAFPIK